MLLPDEFVLVNRFFLEAPLDEWLAVLPDGTDIVISGDAYGPDAIAIQEASSVVATRGLFELQAHRLLATLGTQRAWRLLTIDFGSAANCAHSAFLMCFAPETGLSDASTSRPYVEVAFALASGDIGAEKYHLRIFSTWGSQVDTALKDSPAAPPAARRQYPS